MSRAWTEEEVRWHRAAFEQWREEQEAAVMEAKA